MLIHPSGFQNLGNTCYMNSVLQALLSIDIINYDTSNNDNNDLLTEFVKMINELKKNSSNKPYTPSKFKQELDKKKSIFRGFAQHDAHEFMEYIINEFMECKSKSESKSNLPQTIKKMFTGTTNSYLYCSNCPNILKKEEEYITITLDLSGISKNMDLSGISKNMDLSGISKNMDLSGISKNMDLLNCFDEFSKYERLDENNMWKCSKCETINKAKKKLELNTVPNIVVITLKRFINNQKINTPVEIYEYIILEDIKMKLVGTVNHYGGLGGGHYVSHGLRNGTWYLFNDSQYKEVEIDLKDPSIYIAIYQIDE